MKYIHLCFAFLMLPVFLFAQAPATPGAIAGSASVCAASSQTYSVSPVATATFYNWTLPGGWTGISTSNFITVTVGIAGGTLQVAAGNGSGVSSPASLPIAVIALPTFSITPAGTIHLCPNGIGTTLNADVIAGASYQWYLNGLPILGSQTPDYHINSAGNYSLSVTQNGCTGSNPIQAVADPTPTKPLNISNGKLSFCDGGHVLLQTDITTGIVWSNGANSKQIWATTTGDYFITTYNSFGCGTTSDTIHVKVFPLPTVNAGRDTSIIKGETLQLQAIGGNSFSWSPNNFLDNATVSNPISTPTENILYRITVVGDSGCVNSDDIQITVLPAPFLEPAAAFTPNGDGKNDKWIIKNANLVRSCTINLFDRYGAKVYSFTGVYANDWDGNYNGSALPDADYYYTIQYTQMDGVEQKINGSLTILR